MILKTNYNSYNNLTSNKKNSNQNTPVIKNPYDQHIKCNNIMIIDNETKKKIGEYNLSEAISIAESKNLNLIQISFNDSQNQSICIISNYSKYIYKLNKQENLNKKQKSKVQNKEVTITTIIDLTDLVRKLETIVSYVLQGFSVTLIIKHRQNRNKNTCFSDDFVHKFLQSQFNLQYRVSKKSEKQSNFYITKKKT